MKEFQDLVDIADQLLGPNGCPWDREQTFYSLQPYLLEETHELIEAIDLKNPKKIMEELGDVLYALVFISKLGEKSRDFSLSESIQAVAKKLIRRHPHVFGDVQITSTDDVVKNWEAVKKKEGKKNPVDNIPPTLPALIRAQKVIDKMKRYKHLSYKEKISEDLGQKLWDLVCIAVEEGVDAESALRRISKQYEEEYKNAGDSPVA